LTVARFKVRDLVTLSAIEYPSGYYWAKYNRKWYVVHFQRYLNQVFVSCDGSPWRGNAIAIGPRIVEPS
jgi:hypothetical protein